ncbi:dihydrolipoyl dehydrogenase family protein [Cupriavidus consociatus]|uniref:dihydrolipoyl dehydrogenase family protein n=1 Tax=Cupriavidus consociatus TaxID=2821357 RepID=UPI001AE4E768|nr:MULTISPECIES: FAD-dependent oxidoreductase [unclassified Cupriavidus]MBP0621960.1 FAD-dependent oxidoreductase [Cupriavidus sp. LEh25]MDK2658635.1 FAD-dependent oxidoreductase [Cupriavidus sp. LEh21]
MTERKTTPTATLGTNEPRRARQVSAAPPVERVPRARGQGAGKRRNGKAREADLVVIGGGSGGVACARRAAAHGARVILVERDAIGGTCVNRGCVPKKMLSYGASWAAILSGCLSHTGGREDWRDAIVRVNAEVARLNAGYTQRLHESGVEILRGDARVTAPDEVRVGDETIHARRILIATGARPRTLDVPGGELAASSDDVFTWQTVPASVAVIGGGYIGVEQASILSRYGVKVDLIVAGDRLLTHFDHEMGAALTDALTARGVRVHLNAQVHLLSQANGAVEVCYRPTDRPGHTEAVRAQAALAAIGRISNVQGLGLEELGVAFGDKGGIHVDKQYRSSLRKIYAIGDATDGLHLTPVATAQGRWLADRLYGRRGERADFDFVPTAVFSEPAIGAVGMTEAQAIADAGKPERIRTVVKRFVSLENRFGGTPYQSVFKLVLNARSGRVLGVHLMDNAAPEIVQALAVALRLGVRESQLQTTVQLHPTVAEELFG